MGRYVKAESGFALIGLIVAIFFILLVLSIAAPTVARSLRRDREVEAIHRANQYTRAIRVFYKKTGRYPASIDELQKSNLIRYLRRAYADPFTGKPDWRLIKVGENKTTVKGLFGQPLAGIASTGLGSASGMASSSGTGTPAAAATSSPTTSTGGFGGSTIGSQSAAGFAGTGAPFLGVGLPVSGNAITVVNEQTSYPTWEFLYDPRIEQLRSRVTLFGGSMGSTSAGGLGSAGSLGMGATSAPSTTSAPGLASSPTASPSTP